MLSTIYRDRRFLTLYDTAACLLLFFLAIAVVFTYGSYGFTTDETVDHIKAVRVLSFLSSFGGNRDEITNIDKMAQCQTCLHCYCRSSFQLCPSIPAIL